MGEAPALEVFRVSKRYGHTVALNEVSFRCERGEVHALLGENGAGKSTLVKILSGTVRPDKGDIIVGGHLVHLQSSRDALAAGIATAFQELSLVPYLTVADNLLMAREPRGRLGLVSNRHLLEQAGSILADWEAADIDPRAFVSDLTLANRQRLEIVRALSRKPSLILLDEPTAALGVADVRWLFRQVARARQAGMTAVFISHRIGEVRELCDRVTILRNGHEVRSFVPSEASDEEVVRMMIGRSTEEEYATDLRHGTGGGPPVLVVEKLASQPHFRDVSFNLAQGEIVGVAGLQDQGQRELFMCLAGALRATHGRIHLGQGPVRFGSPRDAMRAGIGLVPEDRAAEGLMLNMGIRPNVSLASLERLATFGFINRRRERLEVARALVSVNVELAKMDDEASSLSGGNQQKVAIAKWLLRGPQVLLLYDPTRGVDVGTKAEIFALMHTIAAQKRGLLFYSTDMEELMNVCNRILVFYRGSIVTDLSGPERTKEAVLSAMLGSTGQQMEVA